MSSPGNVNVALSNAWNSSENRVPVSNAQGPSVPPTIISCQLCPADIVLLQPDPSAPKISSNLLKNLGFQLALNEHELPKIFTNEMSYFCNDCKIDLEEMWELHKQTAKIVLKPQRKVVDARRERVIRKPLVSRAFDAPKFIKLRDLLVQNYYKNKRDREPPTPWVAARNLTTREIEVDVRVSSQVAPQQPVAPEDNSGNTSHLQRSLGAHPTPVLIKNEPVSVAAEAETASEDDDDSDSESVIEVERPSGRQRDLCNGVEVLECVSRNKMRFHQCSACPFRLLFSNVEEKVKMRNRMKIHIKNCHERTRPAKSSPRRGPRPSKYCCNICSKTLP